MPIYVCDTCKEEFGQKGHYERHCRTVKHKRREKPELAKQLADIKQQQMELKIKSKMELMENAMEVKLLQVEKELELKQKEAEVKEKIKEPEIQERVITKTEMLRTSQGLEAFRTKLINMFDEIQDYTDIYNGVYSFQDIFKRDFSALYEEDKVIVIDKSQVNRGYCVNIVNEHTPFYINELSSLFNSFIKCIPLYHKYLKEAAYKEGFKVEKFILSQVDKKELEDWIKEEITILHSNS